MNALITYNDLHPAEREVADLYAWGMTKKEIANHRGKSVRTIENQIRKLFEKSGTRKDTEFTSWYFCSRFSISFDLSPLKRQVLAMSLLILFGFGMMNESSFIRPTRNVRSRTNTAIRIRSSRKDTIEYC